MCNSDSPSIPGVPNSVDIVTGGLNSINDAVDLGTGSQAVNPSTIPTRAPFQQAPAPVRDPAAEAQAMMDAIIGSQPEIFQSHLKYDPLYAALQNSINQNTLTGKNGWLPYYLNEALPVSSAIETTGNTLMRTSDLSDVQALGPGYSAAYRQANPEATSLLTGATSQVLTDLSKNGALAPDEVRQVQQDTRAAYADRGLEASNPAMFAETMNLQGARNTRKQQSLDNVLKTLTGAQSLMIDPVAAVTGKTSNAFNITSGVSGLNTGGGNPNSYDPFSSYASNLYGQNSSNQQQTNSNNAGLNQDYFNTIYNANSAANISNANNTAALYSAGISALGSIGGGAMKAA